MSLTRFAATFVAVALCASSVLAGLSKEMVNWRKGPAQFLMTPADIETWDGLESDSDAQEFIDLFWARRDPTPTTAVNEFKLLFESRVEYADYHFVYGNTRGSVTDRGRITVLLGLPSSIVRTGSAVGADIPALPGSAAAGGSATPSDPAPSNPSGSRSSSSGIEEAFTQSNRSGRAARSETWIYELRGDKLNKVPSWAPQHTLTIPFNDQMSTGDYKIGRWPDTNADELMKLAVKVALVNPDLKTVPRYNAGTAAIQAAQSALTSTALISALDAFNAAAESPYKDAYLTYGSFVTPAGTYFVPVQFYLAKPGTLTPTDQVTFFGKVEDASGTVVKTYEMPAELLPSRSALFADKSLDLPAGRYRASFGLASPEGKPLVISRTELDLKPISKDEPGISPLFLSDNIYALDEAQEETAPFSFGGVKLVVKGDRSFARSDELWLFFEMRNPGLDESGVPKVQLKLDLEGVVGAAKVRLGQAAREVAADALKGVPGHYVVGESIPLSGFKPGRYAITAKVTDLVKSTSYELRESFRVTE